MATATGTRKRNSCRHVNHAVVDVMETPDWRPGDTVRSVVDVVQLGIDAAKMLVGSLLARADTWLCDYGNEPLERIDEQGQTQEL